VSYTEPGGSLLRLQEPDTGPARSRSYVGPIRIRSKFAHQLPAYEHTPLLSVNVCIIQGVSEVMVKNLRMKTTH
jgi:hypothetical protein